jgi:hypothetical protein
VISGIVRLAINRAGIVDAPSRGDNLLRHSGATSMPRAGSTLDAVGMRQIAEVSEALHI